MLILDIGCGRKKIDGAIGIDSSPLSDADISIDLNSDRLPFDDDSVDFIYSSHTLEHLSVDGFFHLMSEAYRVLKPEAQFKIVVPYFTTTLNFANPFHNNNICFNEHTFRFFSSESECEAIPKQEYQTPSCTQWGLRYSANCELNVEFRTLRIDKYYFNNYADLTAYDKAAASSSMLNVVDQISYSLMAVKPCPIRPETGPVSSQDDPHQFVESQLEYLKQQLEYIQQNEMRLPSEFRRAQFFSKVQRQGDFLYCVDQLKLPARFLVLELDYVIQSLTRAIDSYQAGL